MFREGAVARAAQPMTIPGMTAWLQRRGRQRLRHIMRGYRFLKRSNRLGRITAVSEALTKTQLTRCGYRAARLIFGAAFNDAECAVRQYLLLRVGGLALNRGLLHALGKPGSAMVYPLPAEWRKVVEQHGFKVATVRSALAWSGFVLLLFAYGIAVSARQLACSVLDIVRPSFRTVGRCAYFVGLAADNLPQPCRDGRSHDIITWYQRWPGRIGTPGALCHSVRGAASGAVDGVSVIPVPSAITPLTRVGAMARFIGWSLAAFALAMADLVCGRWWPAVMLGEAALASTVRWQEPDRLAQEYLFHNSGWIYRPLWTYEAARHGSRVSFYFYSTNCESFKRRDGYPAPTYGWQAMNWPRYLVWDEYQADFVRRAVGGDAAVSVVGPIWFQSCAVEMPRVEKPGVAVFDITPHRASRYCTLGLDEEFYVPATCTRFLADIDEAVRQMDAVMLWKRKRNIGRVAHSHYRHFTARLSERKGVVSLDPDTSAMRVIESSCAVISMPFSSTALIAKEMGKPSAYYDPTGRVQSDDRAAHGISILSGPDQLKQWLHAQINLQLGVAS